MRVVVFFVCFFSLLLGGNHYVHTGTYKNFGSFTGECITSNHHADINSTDDNYIVVEDNGSDTEDDYFSSDNTDDEVSYPFPGSKCKLAALGNFARYYLLSSDPPGTRFEVLPPVFGPSYPKYITQRVLRI